MELKTNADAGLCSSRPSRMRASTLRRLGNIRLIVQACPYGAEFDAGCCAVVPMSLLSVSTTRGFSGCRLSIKRWSGTTFGVSDAPDAAGLTAAAGVGVLGARNAPG